MHYSANYISVMWVEVGICHFPKGWGFRLCILNMYVWSINAHSRFLEGARVSCWWGLVRHLISLKVWWPPYLHLISHCGMWGNTVIGALVDSTKQWQLSGGVVVCVEQAVSATKTTLRACSGKDMLCAVLLIVSIKKDQLDSVARSTDLSMDFWS